MLFLSLNVSLTNSLYICIYICSTVGKGLCVFVVFSEIRIETPFLCYMKIREGNLCQMIIMIILLILILLH